MRDAFDLIGRIVASDVAHGFPSAQLAVMKDGKMLYAGCWGDVTDDTLFDLASNTKMYAAAYAVQRLVTEGRLSPDTRISEILGDAFAEDTIYVGYVSGTPASLEQNRAWKRGLTVRDVMAHRAGFPADPGYYRADYDFAAQAAGKTAKNVLFAGYDGSEKTRDNTLRMLCATPLMYAPGTRILYSDADYMLLTFVVEKVTGMRLDEYLKKEFWEPLGLERVAFDPLKNGFSADECAPTELHGNTRDGAVRFEGVRTRTLRGEVHDEKAWHCMGGVSGHAGLFASAKDLARLGCLMLDGTSGGRTWFSRRVLELFTSPVDAENDRYGIGWWRQGALRRADYFGTHAPAGTVGHQGWTGTLTVIDRENRVVIAFLTNKIHSPVTAPKANPNRFDGSHYTAASLGFVPQLVYDGLLGIPFDADVNALTEKMRRQYAAEPCGAARRALEAIEEAAAGYFGK